MPKMLFKLSELTNHFFYLMAFAFMSFQVNASFLA